MLREAKLLRRAAASRSCWRGIPARLGPRSAGAHVPTTASGPGRRATARCWSSHDLLGLYLGRAPSSGAALRRGGEHHAADAFEASSPT